MISISFQLATAAEFRQSFCQNRNSRNGQIFHPPAYKNSSLRRNEYGSLSNCTSFGVEAFFFLSPEVFGNRVVFPNFSTPYDYQVFVNRRFGTVTNVQIGGVYGGPIPYTGISSYSGAGEQPSMSGYPNYPGGGGSTPYTTWGANFSFPNYVGPYGPGWFLAGSNINDANYVSTDLIAYWVQGGAGDPAPLVQTVTLSDEIDFSGDYTQCRDGLLAMTWNWGVAAFNKIFKSGGFYSGTDIAGIANDNSIVYGGGPWGLPFSGAAFSGWGIGMFAIVGLAKNPTGHSKSYFIGRIRRCDGYIAPKVFDPYNGEIIQDKYPDGVVIITYVLDLISSGTIANNKVIGIGQDIELPFPDTQPYPPVNLGNNRCIQDLYFAIIGIDPIVWAASVGLTFGTHTAGRQATGAGSPEGSAGGGVGSGGGAGGGAGGGFDDQL